MEKKKLIDLFTIGFALFAMFFGAGNLILPPIIGLTAGISWGGAIFGFFITGVLATFIGFLSVALIGDRFEDLGKRIHPLFGTLIASIIMLSIGPMVAIPRTAATTFEIGVLPLFPKVNPILASISFFAVTLGLTFSSSKVVDIIGKFLTPVLLLTLLILIGFGIAHPLNPQPAGGLDFTKAFSSGFKEGYQTMDVLAAFVFSGIIIAAIKAKGYTEDRERRRATILAGALAMLCLLLIYGGLVYLGATSGYVMDGEIKRTELLLHISHGVLGSTGTVFLALCVALACLTTAIALTSSVAEYFSNLTKQKLSYHFLVIFICVVSCYLSIKGVDTIIDYAYPFLALFYPVTFCMALYLVIFGKTIQQKAPYIAAISITFVIAVLQLLVYLEINKEMASSVLQILPLNEYEIPWVLPSLLFFGIAWLLSRKSSLKTEKF